MSAEVAALQKRSAAQDAEVDRLTRAVGDFEQVVVPGYRDQVEQIGRTLAETSLRLKVEQRRWEEGGGCGVVG